MARFMFRHLSALLAPLHPSRWAVPGQCLICQRWPAHTLCEDCVAHYAAVRPRCPRCALPLQHTAAVCGACALAAGQSRPPPLCACLAAVDYAWPWDGIIARFKFGNQPALARPLAQLMRAMPGLEPLLEQAEVIVPMPLAAQRLAERGYNQAWELAHALAGPEHRRKLQPTLLLRLRATAPQQGLTRRQRQLNLRGALAADPLRTGQIRQRQVLLIDDVMTSGASLEVAARALRQAGAGAVSAAVVARTPPPD